MDYIGGDSTKSEAVIEPPEEASHPLVDKKQSLTDIAKDEFHEFLQFKFQPSKDLAVLVVSYIAMVVTLYTAFQIVTTANVALNFILYGPVTLMFLGIFVPILYNSYIQKRPFSDTGITKKYWILSLIIGISMGIITYLGTLATILLPPFSQLFPLVSMALSVGLFEAIFFRGWIQLTLERSFGAIPAILIAPAFYSVYHIGYGMTLGELWFLYTLGISFAIAFRVTKNILVLWPFYTWIGGLYTNISEGLILPFEASYGFINVLVWTIVIIAILYRKFQPKETG
ncbi:MAG: CPBP family intramembrane glutamic endopeptidase [Candidatus Thorarchaeota archaeon]